MKICAVRHGHRVCELEGPTPILKISKTEIGSCIVFQCFKKKNWGGVFACVALPVNGGRPVLLPAGYPASMDKPASS
jgi:hypothetical protein